METYSGSDVADLIGPGLARALGVADREFTEAQVKSLTLVLQESTALAEAVGDGDTDSLPLLFTPGFMAAHTDFDDFAAFHAASPWGADVAGAFAARDADAQDAQSTQHSSFLSRTTAFETPGEMVQTAVIDRTRRQVDGL
ncbi:hypothetical protein [Haloarchaeobius sp. DFWS5]|uniref:hypothetical protein n=1 Tax=Haloarchaeobius sp. DFWS5 TaxID=3446114 RepID=UPI003EB91E64